MGQRNTTRRAVLLKRCQTTEAVATYFCHLMFPRNLYQIYIGKVFNNVVDPDPQDPYVFMPPGSASGPISQRYGSGSFYHQAKIVRKTLIPTFF
jgi:hypothetical protein